MNPAHADYMYGATGTKPPNCLRCGGEKEQAGKQFDCCHWEGGQRQPGGAP